jgi:hypothetical protein
LFDILLYVIIYIYIHIYEIIENRVGVKEMNISVLFTVSALLQAVITLSLALMSFMGPQVMP